MDGRLILRTVTTPYYVPAMNHGMMPGMPVYDEIKASNRHCCQAMGATIQTHGPGSQHKHSADARETSNLTRDQRIRA